MAEKGKPVISKTLQKLLKKPHVEAGRKGLEVRKKKELQLQRELRKEKIFKYLVEYPLDENVPTRRQVAKATKLPLSAVTDIMAEKDFWIEVCKARRARIAEVATKVDTALFKTAQKGKVDAIKLFYQRFENWTERIGITKEVKTDIDIRLYNMQPEEIIEYITKGEPASCQALPNEEVIEGEIKETEQNEAKEG